MIVSPGPASCRQSASMTSAWAVPASPSWGLQGIAHRVGAEAGQPSHLLRHAADQRRHDETVDGAGFQAGRFERCRDGARRDLEIALVADPALFPVVVVFRIAAAVMVDKVDGQLVAAEIFGDEVIAADGEGGGGIAELQFLRARSLGPALVGRDEQRLAGLCIAPDFLLQGVQQARGAGALGGGEVHRDDGFVEIQRRGEDAGILAVGEGQGGRGKGHGLYRRRTLVQPVRGQAVARGFHAHGQAVLVPVADRALAFRQPPDRRVEPGVGLGDRLAAQSQPRDVGAKGFQADCAGAGHSVPFAFLIAFRVSRPLWRIFPPPVTGLRQWVDAPLDTARKRAYSG